MAVTSEIFFKNNIFRDAVRGMGRKRAKKVYGNIRPFLDGAKRVADVGAGNAFISELLKGDNFEVASFDVADLSLSDSVDTEVFNGKDIPREDNSFDAVLLLSVLHHAQDPKTLMKEAKRISPTIIIMEDVYKNVLHKYVTWFFDSLLNQQFKGHPHSNKTNKEWHDIFEHMNLKVINEKEKWWYMMWHKVYVLKK